MGRNSSDSNSREKNRNRNRYYNHKYRSSSNSSESSRHSKKHRSKISESRHHKKSKHRHKSSSSSDYSSSRHKHSSYSRHKESYSKEKHQERSSSSSSSTQSTVSNKSFKNKQSSNAPYEKKESPLPQLPDIKEDSDISLQKDVDNIMQKEDAIIQINQEGFVFKVFKPSSEQKEMSPVDDNVINVPKLNEEIVQSLSVEDSTFLISNRDRLLNARYKLLTKQERCNNWAKILFKSYQLSEHKDEHLS